MRMKLETSRPSVDQIQDLIGQGYKYYLLDTRETDGIEPQSGMPYTETSMWVFDNRDEAADFMDQVTANPFNPDIKPEIKSLDDLAARENSYLDRARKDQEAAEKRRAARQALPKWRKTRSSMLKLKNEIDSKKAMLAELENSYSTYAQNLEAELRDAGVQFDSIDQVLSKDFLK